MRVLVATDLSDAADLALHRGMELTRSPGDTLAAIHVLPPIPRESMFFPARDQLLAQKADAVFSHRNAAVHERVRRIAPTTTEVFVEEGVDYATIVRRADTFRADLVVVASHGHSGLSRILGGVATRVAAHAPCSVLIVRPTTTHGCVVAASDHSRPSLLAVAAAAKEARRLHARLEVVHANRFVDLEVSYVMQITPALPRTAPEPAVMPEEVRELLARSELEATWHELDGPAATAIIRRADDVGAELVVVGAHGQTALPRLPIGHVAEKIARACAHSVLVVRERQT